MTQVTAGNGYTREKRGSSRAHTYLYLPLPVTWNGDREAVREEQS